MKLKKKTTRGNTRGHRKYKKHTVKRTRNQKVKRATQRSGAAFVQRAREWWKKRRTRNQIVPIDDGQYPVGSLSQSPAPLSTHDVPRHSRTPSPTPDMVRPTSPKNRRERRSKRWEDEHPPSTSVGAVARPPPQSSPSHVPMVQQNARVKLLVERYENVIKAYTDFNNKCKELNLKVNPMTMISSDSRQVITTYKKFMAEVNPSEKELAGTQLVQLGKIRRGLNIVIAELAELKRTLDEQLQQEQQLQQLKYAATLQNAEMRNLEQETADLTADVQNTTNALALPLGSHMTQAQLDELNQYYI
jgi:hypothetical protein